jgi:pSer/pThr/pTyr-binding forkhead associated (FHA) protein/chromosome segregation ATPase
MSQHPTDLFRTSCGATAPLELNISGPGKAGGERRVFEHPFVLVGRHERSCLCLEDGAVSRRHAFLHLLGGRVFCVDLGSRTGIRWEGKPHPAGWLRPEQGIQIGPYTLELATTARAGEGVEDRVAEDWDPLRDRANDPRLLPRVVVEVSSEKPSRWRMSRVLALVGSSSACRVRLRDASVSRYHCSLVGTPAGVWMVDLLSRTGTCLNGQPIRWTLVREGDQLQVGTYVLRVWYQDGSTATPPFGFSEIRVGTPVQPAEDTASPGRRSPRSWDGQGADEQFLCSPPWPSPVTLPAPAGLPVLLPGNGSARALAVSLAEPSATEKSVRVPALQEELDQARERQRDAEVLRQQLADSQAECDRLRAQVGALESQVAEMVGLQAQLEAAQARAGEWELVRAERDQWQAQIQALQDRLASDAAELEEWRQRFEAVRQQLIGEREAVRAAGERLDQESTTLQGVRADLAARNAEHDAAVQRLQEVQDELAHAQDEARGLQAELEQALERQRDVEALKQRLADARVEHAQFRALVLELEDQAASADHLRDQLRAADTETERLGAQLRAAESQAAELGAVRAECDRLRAQVGALEADVTEMAVLQARLEAAEARAAELDIVRAERDRWQTQIQALQDRLASDAAEREQLDRLVADLRAAEVERDRLQTEQQASLHSAEQAWARVSELERTLTEAMAVHEKTLEEAHARWASERQALEALFEQERQARNGAVQTAIRDVQARTAAEREEWRQRLEGAEREFARERETLRQQLADARAEHDLLRYRVQGLEGQATSVDRLQAEFQAAAAETEWLRVQLQTAELRAGELEAVRAACGRWQDEARASRANLELADAELQRLGGLAGELDAVRAERDRLAVEHQDVSQAAEQMQARVGELEQSLVEAAAAQEAERAHLTRALEDAGKRWELERQALGARLEQERMAHAEAEAREVQARDAERQEWRQRLETAERQFARERETLQEREEQARRQATILREERDSLASRLDEADRAAEELAQQARLLRAEIDRERAHAEEQCRRLAVLEQDLQAARSEAAAGREQLATAHNPPGRIAEQPPAVTPDAGGEKTVEHRPVPGTTLAVEGDAGEAPPPPDTPQGFPAPLRGRSSDMEYLRLYMRWQAGKRQGLWQKVLNFVRRK